MHKTYTEAERTCEKAVWCPNWTEVTDLCLYSVFCSLNGDEIELLLRQFVI